MEGRIFDAQVVLSPKDSPLGKVLSQYVCVRVTRMDNVDVRLFDRDWNNAIYFFVLNGDEQIYMRYGGREPQNPDTYNSLESLQGTRNVIRSVAVAPRLPSKPRIDILPILTRIPRWTRKPKRTSRNRRWGISADCGQR